MKYLFGLVVASFLLFGCFRKADENTLICISQIVEHPALNETRRGICDVLKASEFNVSIRYENAQGSTLLANEIAQKILGLKPRVIVAIGTTSAQCFVQGSKKDTIPVIFSSVTDPLGSQIVESLEKPKNITGVSNWIPLEPQIEAFLKIKPELKRLGILYNSGEANSVAIVERLKGLAPRYGLTIVDMAITKTSEIADATRALVEKCDAIFISNDNTALSAFSNIVNIAKASKTPVFCSDTDMVDLGATAALGPNQYELGRQTGQMILKVLHGTPIKELPVEFPKTIELKTPASL
ncbi:MAG: hypothetical protein A2Y14_02730 [Verrucomicrobia bacterium GWF2_51_19]|nr:MAG: hypothetical protein A2Y14_02730 [Verrucomicrobia bacterium GWF2_51_19]HCJ12257.1 ABC transporter substrate-binding protein [Opitutae bacterium]